MRNFGTVICACGCFGIGPTIPLVKALKEKGNKVITIIEARGKDFVFWADKLAKISDEVHILTDCDKQGWANDFIKDYVASGKNVDRIFVLGCPFMMKVCSDASDVTTIVSLTPIMVDGTGMCGACRCEVGGKTKFACVEGPEFEGHEVDWDSLTIRMRQFLPEESKSLNLWERENWHKISRRPMKSEELK